MPSITIRATQRLMISRAVESTFPGRNDRAARCGRASPAWRTATGRRRTTCPARRGRARAPPSRRSRTPTARPWPPSRARPGIPDRDLMPPPELAGHAPGRICSIQWKKVFSCDFGVNAPARRARPRSRAAPAPMSQNHSARSAARCGRRCGRSGRPRARRAFLGAASWNSRSTTALPARRRSPRELAGGLVHPAVEADHRQLLEPRRRPIRSRWGCAPASPRAHRCRS